MLARQLRPAGGQYFYCANRRLIPVSYLSMATLALKPERLEMHKCWTALRTRREQQVGICTQCEANPDRIG